MALQYLRKTAIASLCLLFATTVCAQQTEKELRQKVDVLEKLRTIRVRTEGLEEELKYISAECTKRTMEYLAVCIHSTVKPCKEETRINMLGPIAQKAMEIQKKLKELAQSEKELVAQLDERKAHTYLAARYKERAQALEGLGLDRNTAEAYRQELLKKRNDSLEKSNAALEALAHNEQEKARKAQAELAATRSAAKKASSGWPSWLGGGSEEAKETE